MKNLIRLSIITLIFTMTSESFGQNFGIKAGLNLSNMFIKDSEYFLPYDYTSSDNLKTNPGFHLGGSVEFPLFSMFSFETGFIVTTGGFVSSTEEAFGSATLVTKEKYTLIFLDLPLSAKVMFPVSGFNIYGSVGGYAGMGLFGDIKTEATFGDLVETEKGTIMWGSEASNDNFRRLDYGLSFEAGVKLASFQVGVSYNLGLANLSPEFDFGTINNNRVLGISVGYTFGDPRKSEQVKPIAEAIIREGKEDPGIKEEKVKEIRAKREETPIIAPGKGKAAEIEAERIRLEKIRADSIAVMAEEERVRVE